MKVLDYINNRNYKLTLEKLIIGVEEPIFIKGVGSVLAKADSGNSAFNVLHGEDFYNQGDVVVFTTYDEEDKPHRVSKKVQGTVDINIGAGHTETRPIVLLDVKFAGEEYINVPFTIGNRANNKNKVLLGKEFLTKELDVLIDVSKDNISDKNIEVDVPVTEGAAATEEGGNNVIDSRTSANPSGAATKTEKAIKAAGGGLMGAYKMFRTFAKTGQTLNDGRKEVLQNWDEMVKFINDYQKTDKELIFKFITERFQSQSQRMDNIFKNPQVIKILDYLGNDFAGNNNLSTDDEANQVSEAVEHTVQDNTNIFNKAKKAINNTNKPIVYLVIYNGDKLEAAKQILANNYQKFNGDFNELISAAELTAENKLMSTVCNDIVNLLQQNGINAAIFTCSGIKENRRVIDITNVFSLVDDNGEELKNTEASDNEKVASTDVPDDAAVVEPTVIHNDELAPINRSIIETDSKKFRDFVVKGYKVNPDNVYMLPVFDYTNEANTKKFTVKPNNIAKKVILYYTIHSNIKPITANIIKRLGANKNLVTKLITWFDIDDVTPEINDCIYKINKEMRENGILVACSGDLAFRKITPLGGEPLASSEARPLLTDKELKAKQAKQMSKVRMGEWQKFISSLPKKHTEFTQKQYDLLYSMVDKLTAGKNNYMVPLPVTFEVDEGHDKNIKSVTNKNKQIIVERVSKNKSLNTYKIVRRNYKLYISLIDAKQLNDSDTKFNDTEKMPGSNVNNEVVGDKKAQENIEQKAQIDKKDVVESPAINNEKEEKTNEAEGPVQEPKKAESDKQPDKKETKPEPDDEIVEKPTRKRGRPKGSKNKQSADSGELKTKTEDNAQQKNTSSIATSLTKRGWRRR